MQHLFSKAKFILLLLIVIFGGFAQSQINITGTIFDDAGETLPGVNILLKGQDKRTISDIDGKFGITVPNANAVLVFSFLGFQTLEMKVDRTKPMVVKMEEDTKSLNEVMVIGYQDVRKKRSYRIGSESQY